ncbi:MAG: glyceraldehyde-3-phosphate dehydrogenase [Pseudooceanicola sp.]|jgi:glyceraldehyde 3-phosphate dehydrogenase|nr:glyceraldehyde-3-phosphate dehydrogenase [Pseudooceanicola sp.]|tara:strand:- start:2140 stop:3123 length:984 start_codon:yes stop_codon:yes gene_type:complete
MKLAINGFGRIGRTILRQLLQAPRPGVEVVAINDIASPEECAYLFHYDSTFGPYPAEVIARDGALRIGDTATALTQEPDLRNVDLSGVDVVLECTGIARTGDVASRGLTAGARNVLISGPSPAAEVTVVMGANDDALGTARVVSNASCTTNALAPLLQVVDQIGTVVQGHMTTIHCYTNSQPMVDAPRGDLARSRGGAQSMVPTTSSATDLVNTVLPGLGHRITGAALRVPVASVSAVDLVVTLEQNFDEKSFRHALQTAVSRSPVLGWTDAPLVSSDLRARPESLVIAAPELRVQGPQARIFGWYDNEWGFSARMIDMAARMAARD